MNDKDICDLYGTTFLQGQLHKEKQQEEETLYFLELVIGSCSLIHSLDHYWIMLSHSLDHCEL